MKMRKDPKLSPGQHFRQRRTRRRWPSHWISPAHSLIRGKLLLLVFMFCRRTLSNYNQSPRQSNTPGGWKCQMSLFYFFPPIPLASPSHNIFPLLLCPSSPPPSSFHRSRRGWGSNASNVTVGESLSWIEGPVCRVNQSVRTLDCHWHLPGAHFQLIFKGLHLLKSDYDFFSPTNWLICNWLCVCGGGLFFITGRLGHGSRRRMREGNGSHLAFVTLNPALSFEKEWAFDGLRIDVHWVLNYFSCHRACTVHLSQSN